MLCYYFGPQFHQVWMSTKYKWAGWIVIPATKERTLQTLPGLMALARGELTQSKR